MPQRRRQPRQEIPPLGIRVAMVSGAAAGLAWEPVDIGPGGMRLRVRLPAPDAEVPPEICPGASLSVALDWDDVPAHLRLDARVVGVGDKEGGSASVSLSWQGISSEDEAALGSVLALLKTGGKGGGDAASLAGAASVETENVGERLVYQVMRDAFRDEQPSPQEEQAHREEAAAREVARKAMATYVDLTPGMVDLRTVRGQHADLFHRHGALPMTGGKPGTVRIVMARPPTVQERTALERALQEEVRLHIAREGVVRALLETMFSRRLQPDQAVKEGRVAPRIGRRLRVQYRFVDAAWQPISPGATPLAGMTRNVSTTGILFRGPGMPGKTPPDLVRARTRLAMRLVLPSEETPVDLLCDPMRVGGVEEGEWEYAVRVVAASPQGRERLQRYCIRTQLPSQSGEYQPTGDL